MKRESIAKHIGQKIKEQRETNKFSQEELGGLLNLSRVSIMNMENGRHRVSIDNLFMLCGIFKCKITDLFPPIRVINIIIEEKEIRVKKKVRKIKIVNKHKSK